MAAALAQALESEDFPWQRVTNESLGPVEFPRELPGSPPPPAPARTAERATPPHWTLAQARTQLRAAGGRDELVQVALRYARDFFEFAAVFAVTRDAVAGHDALGTGEDARDLCRGTAIYTHDPGIFRTVIESRAPYLGPVATGLSGNEAILTGLGRGTPRTVLVCPVVIRDRTACVLYCDNGEAPVSPGRLGDLLLFLASLGPALERLIVKRKERQGASSARAPAEPADSRRIAGGRRMADPRACAGAAHRSGYRRWSTRARRRQLEPAPTVEGEVARLIGTVPGSPRRAQSVARLAAQGDAAVKTLVAALPGPLEDERAQEPARLGPVPAALSLHGPAAVPLLLGVLKEGDPARRRAATVLLGATGEPAAFVPLAERAMDSDPRVAASAAEALSRNRYHPAMRAVPDRLRRSLLSGVASRAVGAARALGALRDVDSIPSLIRASRDLLGARCRCRGCGPIPYHPAAIRPRRAAMAHLVEGTSGEGAGRVAVLGLDQPRPYVEGRCGCRAIRGSSFAGGVLSRRTTGRAGGRRACLGGVVDPFRSGALTSAPTEAVALPGNGRLCSPFPSARPPCHNPWTPIRAAPA